MKWHKWNCIILNFTEFVFAVLCFFYRSDSRFPLCCFAAVQEKWRRQYFLHNLYKGDYDTQKCNLKSCRRNSSLILHPSSFVCTLLQLQVWILPSVTLQIFFTCLTDRDQIQTEKNISSMPFFMYSMKYFGKARDVTIFPNHSARVHDLQPSPLFPSHSLS